MSQKELLRGAFVQADALLAAGQKAPAERMFEQILSLDPNHADCQHRLGVIALAAGDSGRALAAFDAALALRPGVAMFHDCRGDALEALGRMAEAITAWRNAIRFDPRAVAPLISLANALAARDDDKATQDEAIQCYRRALALDAAAFAALNGLGLALQGQGRLAEAEAALQAGLRLVPEDPVIHANLGNVLRDMGQLDAAEASLTTALRVVPNDIGARFGLARVHYAAERFDVAEPLLRAVLADAPHSAHTRLILGFLLWGEGRYGEAWEHFEWRNAAAGKTPEIAGPNWDGTDLAGRTLLVMADEGYGDFIHFCRFIPLAARQGRVVVQAPLPLLRLALRIEGVSHVVPRGAPLPAFDLHCSASSLPRAFKAGDVMPIPSTIPYVQSDPADVADWRARLAALPGRKIGLVWGGNPRQKADPIRSIPFAALSPLAGIQGVSFVSLHKGGRADPRVGFPLHDWTDELLDFGDTAALIEGLDLVISVDTAVAHLAGALARPVWLLNRSDGVTDPRWLRRRADCPWYPTMRIFRQPVFGDWNAVIAAVRAALVELAQ